ncbi:MAG: TetR/AcrR family transcriptional regulator [Alphaproteobacteria bacterium]|nr:TetR/AcrR family transcriptional regulator [Alphaproteobacteria bacterium]
MPASAARKKPVRDAAATRARILQAAAEVFAESGYAASTTRAIAERAGVNEVTLFRHFGAKADLLVQAMANAASAFVPAAIRFTGDLEADLARLVRGYQEFARTSARFVATVLSDVPRFPELKPAAEVPRRVLAAAAQVILQYQEAGVLVREHPLAVAGPLLAPILLLAIARQVAPEVAGIDIDPIQHVRRFLSGHAVPKRRGKAA